ncbi:MAG: hypothetical protein WBH90_16285 [Aggregatilineales bacterium]|nr:LiaF-related protein [Aggregatilineales bacterium]HPV06550.1 LiaF-related protein [Aggregatilineales bacterium]HQE18970.1 LiaF-related protein [Aggregatilineales bacterium]
MTGTAEAEAQDRVITGEIAETLGEAQAMRAVIHLGVMALALGARPGRALAASGSYRTSRRLPVNVSYEVRNGTGELNITQRGEGGSTWHTGWRFGFRRRRERTVDYRLDLDLTNAVPLDLNVHVGVGAADLDLSGLNVRSLVVEGGVGRSAITLPRQGSLVLDVTSGVGDLVVEPPAFSDELRIEQLHIASGVGKVRMELPDRGKFEAKVESGMGDVTLQVPTELAAYVECTNGIGRVRIEPGRFERVGHGRWQTPGYATAADRVFIRVDSGMGNVNIVS